VDIASEEARDDDADDDASSCQDDAGLGVDAADLLARLAQLVL
jgi:hypothetical protein